MLIGHRYEHTPEGDLCVHSHNLVTSGMVVAMVVLCLGLPLGWLLGWFSGNGTATPLLFRLTVMTGVFLVLPAMAVVVLTCFGTHETLTLSRRNHSGERRTRMLFGLREQVARFELDAPQALELHTRKYRGRSIAQLWLILPGGRKQLLTPSMIGLLPGRPSTERWLGELAAYLQLPVTRAELELDHAGRDLRPVAQSNARRRRAEAFNAVHAPPPRAKPREPDPSDRIGIPVRAFLVLMGVFLVVYDLNQLVALVTGVLTGGLRVRSPRSTHSYYWAEEPMTFSVYVAFGLFEILVVGAFAWGCFRGANLSVAKPLK